MTTDLQQHVDGLRIWDVHEHTRSEELWTAGPDILEVLFGHYVPGDLISAGCPPDAIKRLRGPAASGDPGAGSSGAGDLEERLVGVRPWIDRVRHTGYGEALTTIAGFYGVEDWSVDQLVAAQQRLRQWQQPGERLRLLRDEAGFDHVQIDNGQRTCPPDPAGPEFFLYDLSWLELGSGLLPLEALAEETDVTVGDLASLRRAIDETFARQGPRAVAVKNNMAYRRTLSWQERSDDDAQAALGRLLAGGHDPQDRLCLGDWCLARGVERAAQYGLPVKIHAGYLAGNHRLAHLDRLRPAHLSGLIDTFRDTTFVLMHTGWPYGDEILALAKHCPNVRLELSWAWSIDPVGTRAFVRRFLHSVPWNKLFAFGGDTGWPTSSWAYGLQARRWLTRALQDEIDEGDLTEKQALEVATALLCGNPADCFNVDSCRAAIRATA